MKTKEQLRIKKYFNALVKEAREKGLSEMDIKCIIFLGIETEYGAKHSDYLLKKYPMLFDSSTKTNKNER